jgi:isochorismate synthase
MNEELIQIHQACIEKHLPFVTFRLPGQDHSTTYIQTTPGNVNWTSVRDISGETGFILAPFDIRNGHRYLLIKPDRIIHSNLIMPDAIREVRALEPRPALLWDSTYPVVTGKETYMDQVEAIKHSISNGAFQKAVLSRIAVVEGNVLPKVPRLYQTICRKHPNAFAYLFKSDDQFWIGASPEPLLQRREGSLSTVSLAGTRPYAERHMNINRWTAKEVLEQEYVTRYIHDVLRAFDIRDYRVSSPYVKRAGNLLHLCTDFTFGYDRIRDRLWELVDALHPTPAVAGHPKDDAIGFIRNLEPHDRGYYTGFLGPVSRDGELDLFVNLRCLKISPDYLSLYVGGGITLDSDPESEWDETRWKAESLLKILRTHIKNLTPLDAPQPAYR